jgi:hypothetical protein
VSSPKAGDYTVHVRRVKKMGQIHACEKKIIIVMGFDTTNKNI